MFVKKKLINGDKLEIVGTVQVGVQLREKRIL